MFKFILHRNPDVTPGSVTVFQNVTVNKKGLSPYFGIGLACTTGCGNFRSTANTVSSVNYYCSHLIQKLITAPCVNCLAIHYIYPAWAVHYVRGLKSPGTWYLFIPGPKFTLRITQRGNAENTTS